MKFKTKHVHKPMILLGIHLAVYGVFWLLLTPPSPLWPSAIFAGLLIWVSFIDFQHFEIPDNASALLLLSGLGVAGLSQSIWINAAAALIWSALFWVVARAFLTVRGFDGLGFGDVKLMAGIGAWLGPEAPIYAVLGASLSAIASILAITALRGEKSFDSTRTGIAFGPFLCLSAWAVWLSGGVS